MPRYIDADKIIKLIRNYGKEAISDGKKTLDPVDDIVSLVHSVDYIPAADVAEVKHGEWINMHDEDILNENTYKCSVCGEIFVSEYGTLKEIECNYCPHCGARMGGENNA